MKRIFPIAALALVMVLGSSLRNAAAAQYADQGYDQGYDDSYQQDREVSYQTFYDELSPHGRWIDYPGQGYVWVPNAGPDFRPYSTSGHWVWTDNYEWMWVSDYDWGWAPFHYGRWDNDPSYGWYWVPGYEWSPAWVAWRDGGDYYGWAPIRPGINISINFNIGGYSPPYDFWCFAPRRYITSPRIYDYYLDRRQNVTIINQTTIIVNNFRYGGNYGFRSGPRRYDAERYIGRINPVRFRNSYSPGRTQFRNNEVSVYRPRVRQDNTRQIAPRQFDRYDRNTARNNNGFRTNDNNTTRRDNTISSRGSNLPDRNNRVSTNPGSTTERRNNNEFRQPRSNTNEGQTNRSDDRRITRPSTEQPGSNNRRFENNGRQPETRNNEVSQRQQQPQVERRQEQPRQFDRRAENDQVRVRQPQPQAERRQEQRQPQQMERRQEQRQPQQMERRQEQRQPQQMERRQEQRQPQQMERRQVQAQPQQRQIERRAENSQQGGNEGSRGNGNGNGNGRKSRF